MTRKLLGVMYLASAFQTQVAVLAGVRVSDGEAELRRKYSPLTKASLLAALGDPTLDVRVLAAIRLADSGEHDAVPFIMAMLKMEPTPGVRATLALEAARLGSEEGLAALTGMCRDGSEPVARLAAAEDMLVFLNNEDCLADIVDILRSSYDSRSGDIEGILQALRLLLRFKHVPPQQLAEIRRLAPAVLMSHDAIVRAFASDVLAKFGDATSIRQLKDALAAEQDETARRAITSAITSLESAQAKQADRQ